MNLMSRLSATLISRVDKTVSLIENHDAVIEASLKDSQRVAARARVKLNRVRNDGNTLRNRLDKLQSQADDWTRRAQEKHQSDRNLALQCVSRRNQCLKDIEETTQALKKHDAMEASVSETIETIEKRVKQMTQQRNQLRSRESAAQALRIVNRMDANVDNGLEDAFERWDMSISETEIAAGYDHTSTVVDSLEQQFVATESEQELNADLDALVAAGDQVQKE